MKKEITLGQLISAALGILITCVTGWVSINNKVSANEEKIRYLQEKQTNSEIMIMRLEEKIDKMTGQTTQILIKLENKKDR